MKHERIERMIEEFLSQNQGRGFCTKCLVNHLLIRKPNDEVAARQVLSNTPEWKQRRRLGRCYVCLAIAETVSAKGRAKM